MLPKKYSHFLLASTLMLTGIYATATEEQAPLKTAEQQAHADSLLKAIDLFKDELLAAGIRCANPEKSLFEGEFGEFTACRTYVANRNELQKERKHCEDACISAFGKSRTYLTFAAMLCDEDRERQIRNSKEQVESTFKSVLPNRFWAEKSHWCNKEHCS